MHCGVAYPGNHEPLVSDELWATVQDVLASRRMAGDRSWKHLHYLRGSLFCEECGSRLGISFSRGKGGTYAYFYCLGRNKNRTVCSVPFLTMDKTEADLRFYWQAIQFSPELAATIRRMITEELDSQRQHDANFLTRSVVDYSDFSDGARSLLTPTSPTPSR